MRIQRTLPDPSDPKSIVEYLSRVQRIVDGGIEVGNPNDPRDPSSTTLANGTAHNGTLVNLLGAWFEIAVEAADTRFDCVHNLNVQVIQVAAANQPNVRWPFVCFKHDGTGINAASTLSVNYDTRDAANITADSFPLRLYVGGGRTVSAAHPVTITVFLTPAVR